jgi:molybdopterin converting factor small subunit
MASITVQFYSIYRLYLGIDRLSLEADDLGDALAQMEERFGSRLREQLQMRGIGLDQKMQDFSLILLNGINIRNLVETKLREGSVLHIFPPSAGG